MSRARLAMAWTAILVLAALLRFVALSRESYWLDELATLDVIGESWSRFAPVLARFDNHPPFYFALAKAWAAIFGNGEAALRSLSAMLGVASVVAAGALAREWSKKSDVAAMAAALFVAVLPISVRHAREARMYSLLELTTLLALLSLTRVLDDRSPRRIAFVFVAHVALLYTHVYGALLVAGEIAFCAGWIIAGRSGGRGQAPPLRGWGRGETGRPADGGTQRAGDAVADGGTQRADDAVADGGDQRADDAVADGGDQRADDAVAHGGTQRADVAVAHGGTQRAGDAVADGGTERGNDAGANGGVENRRVALATLLASVIAFTPWLPVLRSRTATVGERFWIGAPGWTWPVEWAGGHLLGAAFVIALVVGAGIALTRAYGPTSHSYATRSVLLAIAAIASLTALPMALALVYRPIFVPKYAIGAAVVLCVFASLGVAAMKSPTRIAALVVTAGLGLAATITNVLRPRLNEDWRAIAQLASHVCVDGSATVAAARYAPMYRHYLPASCTVLDLEPLVRGPGDPARDAIRERLSTTSDILLLEVHPPRTDARVESVLSATHGRAGALVANDARATRWVRSAP